MVSDDLKDLFVCDNIAINITIITWTYCVSKLFWFWEARTLTEPLLLTLSQIFPFRFLIRLRSHMTCPLEDDA